MSPVSSRTIRMSRPRDDLGPQGRGVGQLGVDVRRAQVGEQAELLAQAAGAPARGAWRAASLSYCGPPTAPNRTASAPLASVERCLGQRVAVRRRRPRRRPAPRRARSSSRRGQVRRSTRTACATISGPMPSPGSTAIFHWNSHGFSARLRRSSKARIFVGVAQRQADLVQPVEQAVLAERIDVEADTSCAPSGSPPSARRGRRSSWKPGNAATSWNSRSTSTAASTIGRKPFLKLLLKKMSAKRRRDHAPGSRSRMQRPRRVLARRAAAEVLAREQDRRAR